MTRALAPLALLLAGCGGVALAEPATYRPPAGANQVFREETRAAPGHELIAVDLNLPANAVGEAHWHPWEEYLYVIEGSTAVDFGNGEQHQLVAGESYIIPRETVHTPRAGPDGVRAIVMRVHAVGDPVSVPAAERLP